MGFHLTIRRPKGKKPITMTEWKALVARHPDMRWNRADSSTYMRGATEVTRHPVDWTGSKYRDEHPGHRAIPYWFLEGYISVPAMAPEDNEHAAAIARELDAQLCGDDGPLEEFTRKTPKKKAARRR